MWELGPQKSYTCQFQIHPFIFKDILVSIKWNWREDVILKAMAVSVSPNLGSICVMRVVKDNYWYFKPAFHVPQQCLYPLPLLALCVSSLSSTNRKISSSSCDLRSGVIQLRYITLCIFKLQEFRLHNCTKIMPSSVDAMTWESKNLVIWSQTMKTGIFWMETIVQKRVRDSDCPVVEWNKELHTNSVVIINELLSL